MMLKTKIIRYEWCCCFTLPEAGKDSDFWFALDIPDYEVNDD